MDIEELKEELMQSRFAMTMGERMQAALLIEILNEIREMRVASETVYEEAEPDPFQTLNGPRL